MNQLQRDYADRLEQELAVHCRDQAQHDARNRRLLGLCLALIFVWAVSLTALLGFLR